MPSRDSDPSDNYCDKIFDAILKDSYSDDELHLIEYVDTFNAVGDSFNHKAKQFMKTSWKPRADVNSSMSDELVLLSSSLIKIVHMALRTNETFYDAAKDVAEIIALDRIKRIDYFVRISTVQFEILSGEDEMCALFEDIMSVEGAGSIQISKQIASFFKIELLSQFMSIKRARLKHT